MEAHLKIMFFISSSQIYVVGTQKNGLDETVNRLTETVQQMSKLMGKKIFTILRLFVFMNLCVFFFFFLCQEW